MHDEELTKPDYLRLSVQRAMVGEVTANLAGLHTTLEGTQIVIAAYFFTEPSEGDLEHFSVITAEVIADYPDHYNIDERVALISEVKRNSIPWNFRRAEVPAN